MNATTFLLMMLFPGPLIGPGPDGSPGIAARVDPGPYLVGAPIGVRVEVSGTSGAGPIEPPAIADVLIREVGREAEGRVVRFVVVPSRPGPLTIPPFRRNLGDRMIGSKPIRLAVANVPGSGRTSAFLGGVGPIEVRAEANPSTLRAGEILEYRLTIIGQAAWGSLRPPDLSGWARLPARPRVEPLPPGEVVGVPPTRTFRYRVRPTVGGRFVLPPLAVAAFDPDSRGYSTRYAPGVPITVEEPPWLDPSLVDYEVDRTSRLVLGLSAGCGLLIILAAALVVATIAGRARARRPIDPVRLADELAKDLHDGPDAARRVAATVAEFLTRAGGRPPGVLTPPEAREFVERLTRDPDLATRVGRLIERCDLERFGGPMALGTNDLPGEARILLREAGRAIKVVRAVANGTRKSGGPGLDSTGRPSPALEATTRLRWGRHSCLPDP